MLPDPDVVVVCCGGGGLLAGVAAAIKLSGCEKTRVYGVEPEGGRMELNTDSLSHLELGFECLSLLESSLHHVQKLPGEEASRHGRQEHRLRAGSTFRRYQSSLIHFLFFCKLDIQSYNAHI